MGVVFPGGDWAAWHGGGGVTNFVSQCSAGAQPSLLQIKPSLYNPMCDIDKLCEVKLHPSIIYMLSAWSVSGNARLSS